MSKSRSDSQPYRGRRDVVAIVASLVMGLLSPTKGWLFFLAGPALLVAIPLLFGVRSRADRLRELGNSTPATSRLATAQLIGLLIAYVCVPGYGDSSGAQMFGFFSIALENPLVKAMWWLSVLGAVVAVGSSIAFFRLWRRAPTV